MDKQFRVGDELSPDNIEVGMIVDVLTGDYHYKECTILVLKPNFVSFETPNFEGAVFNYERFRNNSSIKFLFRGYIKNSPVTSSDNLSSVSEQSITEAIKTLSQAAQELSTHVSVDGKGNVTIYSDYHQEELVFDTAEKLLQYIECVKKLDNFGENRK